MVIRKSSKELLIDSVLELLSEYPLEKITVSKIAENCSLSKRTFYYHFSDKYDLANKAYYYQMCRYCEENKGTLTLHGFLLHLADFIHEHHTYFSHLAQYKGQNNIADFNIIHMREMFIQIIEESFKDEVSSDLFNVITFYIVGMTHYVSDVIAVNTNMTPEEIVTLFEKCVPESLQKYL